MNTTMIQMYGKPSDYKQCKECKHPNWYENEYCIQCSSTSFYSDGNNITQWLDDDYKFYMEEEGYTEDKVDGILIDI